MSKTHSIPSSPLPPLESAVIRVILPDDIGQRFLTYELGVVDPITGKAPKVPVSPSGRKLSGWQLQENQMRLDQAIRGAMSLRNVGRPAGVGVAFRNAPAGYTPEGDPLYLIGLDMDHVIVDLELNDEGAVVRIRLEPSAFAIVKRMDTYCEVSPSMRGIRLLAYSITPLASNKNLKHITPKGAVIDREMFASSGWVTITGMQFAGSQIETRTDILQEISRDWFKGIPSIHRAKGAVRGGKVMFGEIDPHALADSVLNRALVQKWLDEIGQRNDRGEWRDVIWSVLNLGWDGAEELARGWAEKHCLGFEYCWEAGFENVARSFTPARAPGWEFLRKQAELARMSK
jgi:hypothetical protein